MEISEGIPQLLFTDFSSLLPIEYDVGELFRLQFQQSVNACSVFVQRDKKICATILSLQKMIADMKNRSATQPLGVLSLELAAQLIEKQTVASLLDNRLTQTQAIEKYEILSRSFKESIIPLIKQLQQRSHQIGEQYLEPAEFNTWMNILKEAQIRLNTVCYYSNHIEQAAYEIAQFSILAHPSTLKNHLDDLEAGIVEGLAKITKRYRSTVPDTAKQIEKQTSSSASENNYYQSNLVVDQYSSSSRNSRSSSNTNSLMKAGNFDQDKDYNINDNEEGNIKDFQNMNTQSNHSRKNRR